MLSQSDKKFLESTFATKQDLNELKDKLDKLVFDVEVLSQDHLFVVHHSTENFETNERQDFRLDRIEDHLKLPKLSTI